MTKKKIDTQGITVAKSKKAKPGSPKLVDQRKTWARDLKEVLNRVRMLMAMHKLDVPAKMATLEDADEMLGLIIDKVCAKKFVYHVIVELLMPNESDPQGNLIQEGRLIHLNMVFDTYPGEFAIKQAAQKDAFLQALPTAATLSGILDFGLATWGVPNLPPPESKMYGPNSTLVCNSVCTAWVSNNIEKGLSTFSQRHGSISISRKTVN